MRDRRRKRLIDKKMRNRKYNQFTFTTGNTGQDRSIMTSHNSHRENLDIA